MQGGLGTKTSVLAKTSALERSLEELGAVVVAYSGGIDSATLTAVAHRVLGPATLAVTAVSPSLARRELADASELARRFAWAHQVVRTYEGDREEYARTKRIAVTGVSSSYSTYSVR